MLTTPQLLQPWAQFSAHTLKTGDVTAMSVFIMILTKTPSKNVCPCAAVNGQTLLHRLLAELMAKFKH